MLSISSVIGVFGIVLLISSHVIARKSTQLLRTADMHAQDSHKCTLAAGDFAHSRAGNYFDRQSLECSVAAQRALESGRRLQTLPGFLALLGCMFAAAALGLVWQHVIS